MNTKSSDGTTIAFDRAGTGPTVILVSGALGHRAFSPIDGPLAELLSPRHTVVTYDRRGRGESGEVTPYAVEREVDDIAALIQEVGGPAYLVGISSGAVLAMHAARKLSNVAGLVLYEPPFVVDEHRVPRPRDYVANLKEALADGRRGDAVAHFMEFAGVPGEFVDQMRQSPVWPGMEGVAHTLLYDAAVMGYTEPEDPLRARLWGSIATPALVVDGGATEDWLRAGSEAVAGILPNASRLTLPGQAHNVSADALAPVVVNFIAKGTK